MRQIFLPILIFIFFQLNAAKAEPSLIRDAETERFLRELSTPIFRAADLNPDNISIYIVNDNSINAFVSEGQNVFINTGLIRKYRTPETLIGVIAHETGHIKGGHLARNAEGSQAAENAMMFSYLLGIGAMLGGSADAGQALILGGSQTAQRLYARFTRTQEEAADQYAVQFLDKMRYPADGLVRLLEFFESEMIGYKQQIDEYVLSHPISRKRIDLIKARTEGMNFSDKKINQPLQKQMNRVLAKLSGFIDSPDESLKKYQNRHDEEANYVKSIALFRKSKSPESLILLDKIISDNPRDGFLHELKGQILFESGDVENSILAYNQAVKMLSEQDGTLAKISLSAAILTLRSDDESLVNLAIRRLKEAQQIENENPFLLKQLANAYNKIGDEGRSLLALAEFNLLIGDKEKCRKYANDAKEKLDKSAKKDLLRADDLLEAAHEKGKEKTTES